MSIFSVQQKPNHKIGISLKIAVIKFSCQDDTSPFLNFYSPMPLHLPPSHSLHNIQYTPFTASPSTVSLSCLLQLSPSTYAFITFVNKLFCVSLNMLVAGV